LLAAEDSCAGGLINRTAGRELWSAFLAGRDELTGPLWSLLMFQAWLQAERSPSSLPLPSHAVP
jgi:hypothetical protein